MLSNEVDILIFSDRNRKKEIQLSQVSLIIVFGTTSVLLCSQLHLLMLFNVAVFIFCHSFKWVPNLWELLQTQMSEHEALEWPQWIGGHTRRELDLQSIGTSLHPYYTVIIIGILDFGLRTFILDSRLPTGPITIIQRFRLLKPLFSLLPEHCGVVP